MEAKIIKSEKGNPVIAIDNIIGSKPIGEYLFFNQNENLKNKIIYLINKNYKSPYKEAAIEDIDNAEEKVIERAAKKKKYA